MLGQINERCLRLSRTAYRVNLPRPGVFEKSNRIAILSCRCLFLTAIFLTAWRYAFESYHLSTTAFAVVTATFLQSFFHSYSRSSLSCMRCLRDNVAGISWELKNAGGPFLSFSACVTLWTFDLKAIHTFEFVSYQGIQTCSVAPQREQAFFSLSLLWPSSRRALPHKCSPPI